MVRLENAATPWLATTLFVPPRVPPTGFTPMAIVTAPLKLVTVLPIASCAVTCTAGLITEPALWGGARAGGRGRCGGGGAGGGGAGRGGAGGGRGGGRGGRRGPRGGPAPRPRPGGPAPRPPPPGPPGAAAAPPPPPARLGG